MEGSPSYKSHVLILPFLGHGHINPMLHFSERLASKNIKITVAATVSSIKTLPSQPPYISFEPIYDESTDGGYAGPGGFCGLVQRLESSGRKILVELVKKSKETQNPIKCLVYDVSFSWALNLAREVGIMSAAFVTQSCATMASYLKVMEAIANDEPDPLALVPEFGFDKLPSMGEESGRIPTILAYMLRHFEGIEKADWRRMMVGPTLSSIYLENQVENKKRNDHSLLESTGDTCMDWLNTKKPNSVLYVAFGSAVHFSAAQMEEFAWRLNQSNTDFLWVVRASEEHKLPTTFKEEVSGKGLIVSWCAQLDVLSHRAVGCFMTHCGWNSTVEAISFGVPMIPVPQFADQFVDAKFVEEVWEVGMRPKIDDKGYITREEIQRCIKEVMEGEKTEKIKRNALKWKELAVEAVTNGGTTDRNIVEIVERLVNQ
ncbi:hypothetical protein ACHQM5_011166 [Ranunculus cassubicifolius]